MAVARISPAEQASQLFLAVQCRGPEQQAYFAIGEDVFIPTCTQSTTAHLFVHICRPRSNICCTVYFLVASVLTCSAERRKLEDCASPVSEEESQSRETTDDIATDNPTVTHTKVYRNTLQTSRTPLTRFWLY